MGICAARYSRIVRLNRKKIGVCRTCTLASCPTELRVFDELVYDTDANLTNVLIGEDWKIWRVDFTRAFRLSKELRDPKDLVRCDRQLFEKLKTLDGNQVAEQTKHYLNKDEVKAVIARRDKIVQQFEKLISEKGEKEVLY